MPLNSVILQIFVVITMYSRKSFNCLFLTLLTYLAILPAIHAQQRPYIGFVYPAGGQQGTTFEIRLGGQSQDSINSVLLTGSGVSAKIIEYYRRLNNQELQLLNEQLRILKRASSSVASVMAPLKSTEPSSTGLAISEKSASVSSPDEDPLKMITRIEKRTREFVQTPACASISTLTLVQVTIAPDAEPGPREIRLASPRGVSNPLVFHVGQVPEYSRKPMLSATLQVLGKEASALRKRPPEEVEDHVSIPCTLNGQIASGEVNRYRFEARQGQRLVITTLGRQLIPFIADAVPGWFQPVLVLYDANGKEVAYDDDYRFNPDPTLFYEVPKDGEYVCEIHDSIYRGREDFVYRITIGELPFVTSIFPLGASVNHPVNPKISGWNLHGAELKPPATDAGLGIYPLVANRKGFVSNRIMFALATLPECLKQGSPHGLANAQEVTLPIIINGRLEKPGEWNVFRFTGQSNDTVVAEVYARRLYSPLDSVIKLTDAQGACLAFNDDHENLSSGINTHQADSYLMAKLPADGAYYLHLGDTAGQGGEEYAYRLRLSALQPDFALRVVPSSVILRSKSTATVTIYAMRQDGFNGPIKLALKNPPPGFLATPITMSATQTMVRLNFRSTLVATEGPVNLSIVGSAKIGDGEIAHEAVAAEDRMQAFLWRHLVPASELKVLVFDPSYEPPSTRIAPARSPSATVTNSTVASIFAAVANTAARTNITAASTTQAPGKPKFTRQQILGRLRQLKLLYEEGVLTGDFYNEKVAECETLQ